MATDPVWYRPDPQEVEQFRKARAVKEAAVAEPAHVPDVHFTKVTNVVRDEVLRGGIRGNDFLVLMYFVFEFGRYTKEPIKFLDVTVRDLMVALSMSKPTVLEAIDRLVDVHAVLRRELRRNAKGHRQSTRYTLHLEHFRRADWST